MKTEICHYCHKETNDYRTTFESSKVRNPKTGITPVIVVVICDSCDFKKETNATRDYISEIQPLAG